MFHIVLFEPEIPQNTGNIARTCAVTGTQLHLIRPYGFELSGKYIKRAGLDYWGLLDLHEYDSFEDFILQQKPKRLFAITSKSSSYYNKRRFKDGDYFIFGNETSGLPSRIHDLCKGKRLRIPMIPDERARCLNLGNSVSIILYEAIRQTHFSGLS